MTPSEQIDNLYKALLAVLELSNSRLHRLASYRADITRLEEENTRLQQALEQLRTIWTQKGK